MKALPLFSSIFILLFCTTACANFKIIIAKPQTFTNTLYYTGTIAPVTKTAITAPTDGTLTKIFFSYGANIKAGQKLYCIKTNDKNSNFQQSFTEYLKAQQNFISAKDKTHSNTQLYQDGLIAKNEYETTKNSYYLAELSYMQAKTNFNAILRQHKIDNFPKVNLQNINSIKNLLAQLKPKIDNIEIAAPISGTALLPKNSEQPLPGTQIKAGQILLYLGNLSGVSIQIKISEIDINQIHIGQTATITSAAFPGLTLHGVVEQINSQALNNNGTPAFPVTITIPKLTPAQQKLVHVGMSAKVAISLEHCKQILIPINAVSYKNGQSMIKLSLKNSTKTKMVAVTTGPTTANSVIITQGLNSGDRVVIP